MAANGGEKKNVDFYKILGLEKECSPTDLKNAYRKLAKRWHPDRCCASGNSKIVEEAKLKFQAIQEAYTVLSDETKRFLYDVGIYDNDDDDNNHGMGDFLNEMVTLMSEHQPNGNGEESFEQLQEMFEEMFQRDSIDTFASTSQGISPFCSSSYASSIEGSFIISKRNSSEMSRTDGSSSFNANFQSFCTGDKLDGCRNIQWRPQDFYNDRWSSWETRERQRPQRELQKELKKAALLVVAAMVVIAVEDDMVKNKRLLLAMMSLQTITPAFSREPYCG